ncbi:hypothetical protein JOD64_003061 [Micromonospora luteifusca]|uniref:DUF4179 domain-containing protein n=1 Tax=Micromonospora luteifusca TaxID=709860 RepID=A0ABS2LW16_9ACTN|nr:hypothetical protein [Micromonospora luteifusca]MBM7491839.1 hypothetical protein [Micromonospora luteifusca]
MIEDMDVARLMRAEVEAAEKPSAVNIERAMIAGRRQRWYARSAGAALAVVAVAVGAVTVPGLVAPDRSSPPSLEMVGALAPLEPYTGEVTSPDASRIPAALETIDPTVQYVRFGWLPSGLASLQYGAGLSQTGGLGVFLNGHAGDPQNWGGVSVHLYPKGVTPPAPQVMGIDQRAPTVSTAPAPDVRGAAATFTLYDVDGTDRLSLRWQYAPDGWAAVDVSPWAAGQDAREIALHVAQKLRFSTTERVQMPAQVMGVPQNLRLIYATVNGPLTPDGWRWYASVSYSAEPPTANPGTQWAKTLDVSFSPYVVMTDKIRAELNGKLLHEPPNTTIDGHQAAFYAAADPSWMERLDVLDVRGMVVRIDAHRGTLDEQGTKGLFQRLDLAGAKPDWRPSLMVD